MLPRRAMFGVIPPLHHGVLPMHHGMMPGQHTALIGGVSVLLKPPHSMMSRPILPSLLDEQQFCLRWEQHLSNQQAMFARLLERGSFCDVALVCEEKLINVHKLVLSSSSPYFELILTQYEKKDPVIILKDIKYETMLALVHFMYKGEVCVDQSKLAEVLEAARALKVKGLSEEVSDNGLPRGPGPAPGPGLGLKRPQEMPSHPVAMKKTRRRGRPKKIISQPIPVQVEVAVPVRKRRRRNMGRPRKVREEEKESAVEEVEHKEDDIKKIEEADSDEVASKGRQSKAVEPEVEVICEENPLKLDSPPGSPTTPAPIIQLDEYVKRGGTHARYWTEPWVSRVMDAIKRKEMSLQDGANQLGIKYQSLYGRYRVHHGYLITRTSDKPNRRNNDDSDNSLSLDCERSFCSNDWDPSLNLEPLIQIDMDEDNIVSAQQRQRDKSNDAANNMEASSILGL